MLTGLYSFAASVQYLRASKQRLETYLAALFWRNGLPKVATYPVPFPRLRQPTPAFSATAYWRRQDILAQVRSLRAFTSASIRLKHEKVDPQRSLAAFKQQTSLTAVLIYETSPASVGIDGWYGYEEFIPLGTTLPYIKTVKLRSAFDHIHKDTIQVCGCLPGVQLRVDLAELTVHGIRKAEKEKTILEATMLLRIDLTGTFTARFTPGDGETTAEVSVDFCGGQVLIQGDGDTGLCVQSSSFIVLDKWHDTWMLS